jgi:Ca2+/Na+ antiporter
MSCIITLFIFWKVKSEAHSDGHSAYFNNKAGDYMRSVVINLCLLFVLTIVVLLYQLQWINDNILAFFVIPIFIYFVVWKEKAIIHPINEMKHHLRQKTNKSE